MTQFSNNSASMMTSESVKAIDSQIRESLSSDPDGGEARLIAEQEKLAENFKALRSKGAPKQLVMEALGLTEDDYSKLSAREDVKEAVIKAELARTSASVSFDSNWDKVEDMALKAVARELASSPEPEFALKAAAVANKAVRRRREDAKLAQQQNGVIANIGNANIAILSLPKVFMNELVNQTSQQAQRQIAIQRSAVETKKLESMADVGTIREVLGYQIDLGESQSHPQSGLAGRFNDHSPSQTINGTLTESRTLAKLNDHSVDDLFADLADTSEEE